MHSNVITRACLATLAIIGSLQTTVASARSPELDEAVRQFRERSGADLVFERSSLPRGSYYARMASLAAERRLRAARILVEEVAKYPAGYLKAIGLTTIGVFGQCQSSATEGHRGGSDEGGTTYYGLWNGSGAIVNCYYSDRQLPTTFHHEVFHAVDGAHQGVMSQHRFYTADDARFSRALSGQAPYPALTLSTRDVRALERLSKGSILKQRVSDYAASAIGEDQAETARWFMTRLADSLVQMTRHPDLGGTQRLLHVLEQYRLAVKDGPGVDWFVDVALGRGNEVASVDDSDDDRGAADDDAQVDTAELIAALERLAKRRALDDEDVRFARETITWLADQEDLATEAGSRIVAAAVALTPRLVEARIQPRGDRFTVWTSQSNTQGNPTLRDDLATFAKDVTRLGRLSGWATRRQVGELARAQLEVLKLVARYRAFIRANWSVSRTTDAAFTSARNAMAAALPRSAEQARRFASAASWDELAGRAAPAPDDHLPTAPAAAPPVARAHAPNPYLSKVDEVVRDPKVRTAIRLVQPATVKIGGGSGINLLSTGLVLTNAHVAKAVGQSYSAVFPDGRRFSGVTIASDHHFDLALVRLEGASDLPTAPIADAAPRVGARVVVIGQPGTRTPDGQPTGYQPFHVSTGQIRGFLDDPLGKQSLGRTKHDAWTYWGHSGSPLFGTDGAIVALHNSWDSSTAMRHAVTWQAITRFLTRHRVDYERR